MLEPIAVGLWLSTELCIEGSVAAGLTVLELWITVEGTVPQLFGSVVV